jgi:hypothetical protein
MIDQIAKNTMIMVGLLGLLGLGGLMRKKDEVHRDTTAGRTDVRR